ncbi:amidohydrolase [Thermosinus carboxydivorans Nor1]|uniref:Amidohydrolase n=1 Tax=Thermosinus carboxydivorans Nor1 TaxID=401526 RepID=A1HU80_9FIRM|nr:amidohydrolase [Thermosinus carboxydivorans]EAX46422.1 amidohydrolase [Thermosinus carboxydivorans Nor1]
MVFAEEDWYELQQFMVEKRRDLHRYPEISTQESRTSQVVAEYLRGLGVEVQTFNGHHGVVGIIRGAAPGPVIALRADMDALPVIEENDVPYKSAVPGVMHACGHDAHTAILMGVAKMLAASREELAGAIKLLFQPAEEAAPVGGAQLLIDDGVLESPKVDAIFGLHVWPDVPLGQIALRTGPMMAASDRFTIKVLGRGAHAAEPHKGVDAIAVAVEVYQGLSKIMHRFISPRETATISVGAIRGGERYNVIPREVVMEGTVRTLSENVRQAIPKLVERMVQGVTAAYGAGYELDYQFGYPVLVNDAKAAGIVAEAAAEVIGCAALQPVEPILGAEDFARYLAKVPGAFFLLGCQQPGNAYPLHSSRFDVDERALLLGARVMYSVVRKALAAYAPDAALRAS